MAPEAPRTAALLWLATVVLVTLNLRPFLTAIGPLGQAIQAGTGMDLAALSWLTLLPMALMGAGTWAAPAALRRLGARACVAGALALIALGCLARLGGTDAGVLLASSALCGAGVALVQGVLPGLIKRRSPGGVAQMMGVYSASLMGGGALGAQLSPLALQWGLGWQAALALWAAPVLPALALAWHTLRAPPAPRAPAATAPAHDDTGWLMRRPRTWLLMLCFGLVNGGYASMVAWLAPHYQSLGWSAARSGLLVAVLSVAQAAAALSLPALAASRPDRRGWLWCALACQAIGFALLAWWPLAAPQATAIVLGAGLGGCFALIMVVALDHLPDPAQAGALNALMQGGGFILAALAPWVVARLHQATGGFAAGWLAQLGAVLAACVLAARLSPVHYARVMRAPA
ncbi:MFS transporter [Pulveribacter sp.]|uniref:MFS transporter n=1 Tax=Pulveribacter sp. TaxID=2678893 RepID=UPI0028B0B11D|nr:MFS transporter [Pulveribacter sp.]